MPDMFSDEKKRAENTHTQVYTDMCIHIQKKGGRTMSKFKTTELQYTHSHTPQKKKKRKNC